MAARRYAVGAGYIRPWTFTAERSCARVLQGLLEGYRVRATLVPHRMAACHIRARTTGSGERRFDVRYRRGGRYFPMEHAGTFGTLREARLRRDLVRGWLAAGLNPRVELRRATAGSSRDVASVANDWLASRKRISERTREEYRRRADVIADRFEVRPEEVTPADVRAWVAELESRHKPSTVGLFVQTLRMILDHAELAENPARHRSVELPRVERKTLDPPDADEVVAVVRALPFAARPAVVLLEQTGLRVSEAVQLGPDDREPGRVRVRAETSKTRVARWAPCPQWLEVELPIGGSRQTIHHAVKRACKNAGVAPFGPHMLRHRRATLWHQQGVTPVEAAARLGHSPVEHLRTYAHVRRLSEVPAQLLDSLLR